MVEKYKIDVHLNPQPIQLGDKVISGFPVATHVEGLMTLEVFENINCRGIWLELGYREHGRGTTSENQMVQQMIYTGNLVVHQPVEYRIDFLIPDQGPVTYHGQNVNLDWFVRFRIDIPFWFDKRHEYPFIVLPLTFLSRHDAYQFLGVQMPQ